jgi:hypothetical protein
LKNTRIEGDVTLKSSMNDIMISKSNKRALNNNYTHPVKQNYREIFVECQLEHLNTIKIGIKAEEL